MFLASTPSPLIEPAFFLFTLVDEDPVSWQWGRRRGRLLCVPKGLLSGLMGMEAQFQEDLPCLLREFQESDKDLRLSCSFLLCVSQRVRNLSIAGQSCVSCCLEWTAVCLHWSETGTGLPQEAWQIRRCFVLGNRGPRADVSTVLISQARWELSSRHGYQQREADAWWLWGTRQRRGCQYGQMTSKDQMSPL